jgi:HEXXH motif-containing protein
MNGAGATAFMPADCQGLCYPELPGTTIDVAMNVISLVRSQRALQLCRAEGLDWDGVERRLAEAIDEVLTQLAPIERASLFRTAAAALDLDGDQSASVVTPLRLVRHLIRHPDVRTAIFVLPPCLFSDGSTLYLPHVHALLAKPKDGVILAIVQEGSVTRLIWSDGVSVTLPNDGTPLPREVSTLRLQILSHFGRLPLLNGVSEYDVTGVDMGTADHMEFSRNGGIMHDGFKLLGEVWPIALSAANRHLRGILLLEQRQYVRSHSPPELGGAILTTLDAPDRLADVLCHEVSHVRMNAFRHFDPIALPADQDTETRGFVSPWRPDLRPLRGLIDGIHAFLNVCGFHRRYAELFPNTGAEAIYERQAANVRAAWHTLRRNAIPTTLGAELFAQFEVEVATL